MEPGLKYRSSKRAKALSVSQTVKRAVYDRDMGACVWCGLPGIPEAHYIPRSMGGLGVEENILTLCRNCHGRYDNGARAERQCMREEFKRYLSSLYDDWDEDNLIYRRV